jgi:hypothetical protein
MSEPASNTFSAGDLALCINSRGWRASDCPDTFDGPTAGQVLTVRIVTRALHHGAVLDGLGFDAWPGDVFDPVSFRKITPGADLDGVEVERRIAVPHLFPGIA